VSDELEPAAELTALESNEKGVRVRFYRHRDRYRHVVEAIVCGRGTTLLESAEGDPDQHWPHSPPFQELQCQANEKAVLLTGSAGACHWSASVQVSRRNTVTLPADAFSAHIPDGSDVIFDVACRSRTSPAWIGSSYHLLGDAAGCLPAFAFAGTRNGPAVAIAKTQRECIVTTDSGGDGNRHIIINPIMHQTKDMPTTIRWAYRIFLATN
jgi:hypothetical protein